MALSPCNSRDYIIQNTSFIIVNCYCTVNVSNSGSALAHSNSKIDNDVI